MYCFMDFCVSWADVFFLFLVIRLKSNWTNKVKRLSYLVLFSIFNMKLKITQVGQLKEAAVVNRKH